MRLVRRRVVLPTRSFQLGAILAAALLIGAAAAATSSAATPSNVCRATGVTNAVTAKIFVAGVRAKSTFDQVGYCTIGNTYVVINLYPRSDYATRPAASGYPGLGGVKLAKPSGLGPGPVFFLKRAGLVTWMDFEGGPYVVELKLTGPTSPPQSQWVALARAIHAHLG